MKRKPQGEIAGTAACCVTISTIVLTSLPVGNHHHESRRGDDTPLSRARHQSVANARIKEEEVRGSGLLQHDTRREYGDDVQCVQEDTGNDRTKAGALHAGRVEVGGGCRGVRGACAVLQLNARRG